MDHFGNRDQKAQSPRLIGEHGSPGTLEFWWCCFDTTSDRHSGITADGWSQFSRSRSFIDDRAAERTLLPLAADAALPS